MQLNRIILLIPLFVALNRHGQEDGPNGGPALENKIPDKARGDSDEAALKLKTQIAKLGDANFETRAEARAAIAKGGAAALPLLVEAARGADPEIKAQAITLIDTLGWHWEKAYAKLKPKETMQSDIEPVRIESGSLREFFPAYRFYKKVDHQYRVYYAIKVLKEEGIRLKEDNVPGVPADQIQRGLDTIVEIARDSGVRLNKESDVLAFWRATRPMLWGEDFEGDKLHAKKVEKGWTIDEMGTWIIEIDKDGTPAKFYLSKP